jgi:hypothetical protein
MSEQNASWRVNEHEKETSLQSRASEPGDVEHDRGANSAQPEDPRSFTIFQRVASLYPASPATAAPSAIPDPRLPPAIARPKRPPNIVVPSLELGNQDEKSWIAAASNSTLSSARRARLLDRDHMLSHVGSPAPGPAGTLITVTTCAGSQPRVPELRLSPSSAAHLSFDLEDSSHASDQQKSPDTDEAPGSQRPDTIVRRPIGTNASSFERISSRLPGQAADAVDAQRASSAHAVVARQSSNLRRSRSLHDILNSRTFRTTKTTVRAVTQTPAKSDCDAEMDSKLRHNNSADASPSSGPGFGTANGARGIHEHDYKNVFSPHQSARIRASIALHSVPGEMRAKLGMDPSRSPPDATSTTRLALGIRNVRNKGESSRSRSSRASIVTRAGPDVPEAARTEFTVAYPVAYTADLLSTVCQDSLGLRVFKRVTGDKLRVERDDREGPHLVAAVLLNTQSDSLRPSTDDVCNTVDFLRRPRDTAGNDCS